jgi:hypothetical protein
MPHYRTLEAVTFVDDGKVIHYGAGKRVTLTESQAKLLGDKVVDLTPVGARMFPEGAPVIDSVRPNPANDGANEAKVEPVKAVAKK